MYSVFSLEFLTDFFFPPIFCQNSGVYGIQNKCNLKIKKN